MSENVDWNYGDNQTPNLKNYISKKWFNCCSSLMYNVPTKRFSEAWYSKFLIFELKRSRIKIRESFIVQIWI